MNSTLPENELLSRISEGDEEAFTTLFEKFSPRVMHVAKRFTRSDSISEDIVQDVFLQVWLKREQLPGIKNFTGWLFIIARNRSLNALEKIARMQHFDEWDGLPLSQEAGEGKMVSRELQENIRQAMQLLTEQQQRVFQLAKLQGMNRDEVSRELGLSPNTVKMHLLRSTRIVRAYLQARMEWVVVWGMLLLHFFIKN